MIWLDRSMSHVPHFVPTRLCLNTFSHHLKLAKLLNKTTVTCTSTGTERDQFVLVYVIAEAAKLSCLCGQPETANMQNNSFFLPPPLVSWINGVTCRQRTSPHLWGAKWIPGVGCLEASCCWLDCRFLAAHIAAVLLGRANSCECGNLVRYWGAAAVLSLTATTF